MEGAYPRDLLGYGNAPPDPKWPNNAQLALQFVINFEEGGESCILHGDPASEAFLSEVPTAAPIPGARNMNMESMYEYGTRAGFWRLHRIFQEHNIPCTVFAVAMALERNRPAVSAMVESGWEVASHGYRWIDYQHVSMEVEREHIRRAVEIHQAVTGSRPLGLYQGRVSPNTRQLAMEEGGFLYDSDSYADDLPYWVQNGKQRHLVVPYSLDCNDFRFSLPAGFTCGSQFYTYLRDTFDFLYQEGRVAPKMMSVGLHCRLAGRPGRAAALAKFIEYAKAHSGVWICRRVDIARHWWKHHAHPP